MVTTAFGTYNKIAPYLVSEFYGAKYFVNYCCLAIRTAKTCIEVRFPLGVGSCETNLKIFYQVSCPWIIRQIPKPWTHVNIKCDQCKNLGWSPH